jgi:hypothetical protein
MEKVHRVRGILLTGVLSAFAMGMAGCQLGLANVGHQGAGVETPQAAAQEDSGPALVIENDSELPDTYPQAPYEMRFLGHGGISTLHWRVEKGALPPGIKLEDDGLLHGRAERMGEFQFTVSLTDAGHHPGVQKGFVLRVRSALSLKWGKAPAHVNGNRIEGNVEVSNTTPDDIDLTFVVMAVAENGRATAIGYHHFVLRRGTLSKELPFGETLPNGGYAVHVDAVGEVAPRNLIYRDKLDTPAPLQVSVRP